MKKLSIITLFLLVSARLMAQKELPFPSEYTVAQDGSGNYKTIQEAVNAVRDLSQQVVTIHIKKGTYHEKLIIPSWKTKVLLIGEDKENTIITNDDHTGKNNPGGKDAFGRPKMNTYTSFTVLVQGNDFTAENLTIENTSGKGSGQGVALDAEGDRCQFINCRLLGNQDTLYTATETSRQYYKDCYIEGTTDFIFGEATCVFQSCTIRNLMNSYITAPSTTANQKFGYVLFDCKLIADTSVKKVFLGRPWRPHGKTVYIRTEMGIHIAPIGWDPWKNTNNIDNTKTAFFAEYKSTGPGANIKDRAAWTHQLTDKEAKEYTLANIFGGKGGWVPAQ